MERYALERNLNGRWIRLNHCNNLSKLKAEFYIYLCAKMSISHTHKQELRCVSL